MCLVKITCKIRRNPELVTHFLLRSGFIFFLKDHFKRFNTYTDDSLDKSLMLGKVKRRRRRRHQRIRWMDGITDAMNMNTGNLREMVRGRETWHAAVHGVTKSWTQLGDWTRTTTYSFILCLNYFYSLMGKIKQTIFKALNCVTWIF